MGPDLQLWEWLTLAILLLLGLTWVGYPLTLCLPAKPRSAPQNPVMPSTVAIDIILSAYNEEAHIAARVENLLEQIGDARNWRIRIGDDASDDRTPDILEELSARNQRILIARTDTRSGKPAMLKKLVAESTADILVFTDANTAFAGDALPRLLASFSNTETGGTCGRLVFKENTGTKTEELSYWALETWMKTRESSMDSCLGANGAIYAIRREYFPADIPDNTIVDDFVIGMKIREQGKRMLYVRDAIAVEDTPSKVSDEWQRRVRIGSGDFQALALCARCLHPSYGVFAFAFFWHKVMRWYTPHLLFLLALICSIAALEGSRMASALILAALFVMILTLAGRMLPGKAGRRFNAVAYFLMMQMAIFVGWIKYLGGDLQGTWERTDRNNTSSAASPNPE